MFFEIFSILCFFPFSRSGEFSVSLAVASFVFLVVKLCGLFYVSHEFIAVSLRRQKYATTVQVALLFVQTGASFAENVLGPSVLIWNRKKIHSLAKYLPPRKFSSYKYHFIPLFLMSALRIFLFSRNLYNAQNYYMVILASYKLAMGYMQYEALARALTHTAFLASASEFTDRLRNNSYCILHMSTTYKIADAVEKLNALFGVQVIFYSADAIWRITNAGVGFLNAIGVMKDFPLTDFSFKLITTETFTFTQYGMLLLTSGCQSFQDSVSAEM